jgi:hypothetical protein
LALISVIALAAVAGTLLATAQLNVNADTNSTGTVTTDNTDTNNNTTTPATGDTVQMFAGCLGHGRMHFNGVSEGYGGQIQVSDEFEQNVTNIANADSDVETLLNNGYNVTSITPLFHSIVDGNGNMTTKASNAILVLTKDDTNSMGRAIVQVDLDQAKVTSIYTETKTLIEK